MRRKVASVLLISNTCKYPLNHFTGSAGIHVYMYIFIYIHTQKKTRKCLQQYRPSLQACYPHTTDLCGGSWSKGHSTTRALRIRKMTLKILEMRGNNRPSRSFRFSIERFLCCLIHYTWWVLSLSPCGQGCPILWPSQVSHVAVSYTKPTATIIRHHPCFTIFQCQNPRHSAPGRKRMKRKEQARRNFTSAACSLVSSASCWQTATSKTSFETLVPPRPLRQLPNDHLRTKDSSSFHVQKKLKSCWIQRYKLSAAHIELANRPFIE